MLCRTNLQVGFCLVAIVAIVGMAMHPLETIAQDESLNLRVMSYNIKHGQGNDECADPTVVEGELPEVQCAVDLERTGEVIRAQNPDIVAIQEVDRFWARSGSVDQPDELATMLDMDPCFAPNLDHGPDDHGAEDHQYGTLILSRFPILSCENTLLPTPDGWEQRGLLEARIELDGFGEIAVLNTHLQAGREGSEAEAVRQRTEQAEAVAAKVKGIDVPVILMGDFNAQPDDPELASLFDAQSGLQDVWAVGGDGTDGFTVPVEETADPESRIDYIFVSSDSDVVVNAADVVIDEGTRIASDHYPVIADLTLPTDGAPAATPGAPVFATPVD